MGSLFKAVSPAFAVGSALSGDDSKDPPDSSPALTAPKVGGRPRQVTGLLGIKTGGSDSPRPEEGLG